jgi:hypothetical protein
MGKDMIQMHHPHKQASHYSALHVLNQASTLLQGGSISHRTHSSVSFLSKWTSCLRLLHSWLYRRSIVVDGNFSLEHMKMKNSKDDVFLSDGEGYMVEMSPYQEHLDMSLETTQVCLWQDLLIQCSHYVTVCHLCQPQSC